MRLLDQFSKPKTAVTTTKKSISSRIRNVIALAFNRKTETVRKDDRYFMPYDPDTMQNLGLSCYLLCGQVFSGFNMIAFTMCKGLTVNVLSQNEADKEKVDRWVKKVRLREKAEMMVINSLVFGRTIMEVGATKNSYLKIRDPRDFTFDWDEDKQIITEIKQENNDEFIDTQKIETFMFRRLFSDTEYGISACYPAFNTVEDLLELFKSNREILKRYRKPLVVAYRPDNASPEEEQDMISIFEDEDYKGWIIAPQDWVIDVKGMGNAQFKIDELMAQITHQIFHDLGIPETIFQPEAYKSTTHEHIKLILYERIKPEQFKLKLFLEHIIRKHLKVPVEVSFDEMRTEDSLMRIKIMQEILASIEKGQDLKAVYLYGSQEGQMLVDNICSKLLDEAKVLIDEGVL